MNKWLKCLFFLFLLLPISTSASISVESKPFTLSGIETELKIKGIDTVLNKAFQYKIASGNKTLVSGLTNLSSEHIFKVTLHDSGINNLTLTIGSETIDYSIRVLPGWISLLPPIIAIVFAILTKQVLPSLLLAIWVGAFFIYDYNLLLSFLRALDKYLIGAIAEPSHAAIIVFTLCIGGMVGIIIRIGGMQGIINKLSSYANTPRSAQFFTWLMGIMIFFDDYANTLIVGNSMRPLTDKAKVSREKLSYIVDSTSAPIAGIAVLSTWIGFEIGLIRDAYIGIGITESNFYALFLQTIPFRFYCLLTLFFVLFVTLSKKEFGPMLKAEQRAYHEGKPLSDEAKPMANIESQIEALPENMPKRWYNALIPIFCIILGTFIGLPCEGGFFSHHFYMPTVSSIANETMTQFKVSSQSIETFSLAVSTKEDPHIRINYDKNLVYGNLHGKDAINAIQQLSVGDIFYAEVAASTMSLSERLRSAFAGADSSKVLLWASAFGSIIALLLGKTQKIITLEKGFDAWLKGVQSLITAVIIMSLAWSINSICTDLGTAKYIISSVSTIIPYWLLPTIIFIISFLISFATGTSWGTMAILLPISIPLAYHLNLQHYNSEIALIPNAPEMMIYIKSTILVNIGAVLEGSIFGDHCSPISDTTIMSSLASESDHIDHVKTQAPYAALVGLVAILFCYIPAGLGLSPYLLLVIAGMVLATFVYAFGKNPSHPINQLNQEVQ
ncbi:MAG: Na+/H+ antiporter NhaC family protein [Candidatus Riflebacteria bacterium]|nr:Na+/H+ antiporter NhaC family protein [Candidatus Riflebacteria bacterium]